MKKILSMLLLLVASNAMAACSHTDKADDNREVASEDVKAEQWKAHQKYLEKIDKIR